MKYLFLLLIFVISCNDPNPPIITPTPTPEPTPIVKPSPTPEPVVNTFPWPETHKLIAWSGTFYSGLAVRLDINKLREFYDSMAVDVNSERNFAWLSPAYWPDETILPFTKLDDGKYNLLLPDENYYLNLDLILQMTSERKITEIISLVDFCSFYGEAKGRDVWGMNPFNGANNINGTYATAPGEPAGERFIWHPQTREVFLQYVDTFVKRTKKYLPYIIYEIGNEPAGDYENLYEWYQLVINKLKENGVPNSNIQVSWFDSSYFGYLMRDDLGGEGIGAVHGVGSETSIDRFLVGAMGDLLVPLGAMPSSDGPDSWNDAGQSFARGTLGLGWPEQARRPAPDQLKYIVSRILSKGGRGFENLSAAPVLTSTFIDLDSAIVGGQTEREGMRQGYFMWHILGAK